MLFYQDTILAAQQRGAACILLTLLRARCAGTVYSFLGWPLSDWLASVTMTLHFAAFLGADKLWAHSGLSSALKWLLISVWV